VPVQRDDVDHPWVRGSLARGVDELVAGTPASKKHVTHVDPQQWSGHPRALRSHGMTRQARDGGQQLHGLAQGGTPLQAGRQSARGLVGVTAEVECERRGWR
jgi:hypothetical protein